MFSERAKTLVFVAWSIAVFLAAIAIGITSVQNWVVVACVAVVPPLPPDEVRPPVPAAYMPLYTYLDRRYGVIVIEGLRLHGVWRCARERQHECRTDALRGLNIDPAMHRSHAVIDN
jgi:hypothetical protein